MFQEKEEKRRNTKLLFQKRITQFTQLTQPTQLFVSRKRRNTKQEKRTEENRREQKRTEEKKREEKRTEENRTEDKRCCSAVQRKEENRREENRREEVLFCCSEKRREENRTEDAVLLFEESQLFVSQVTSNKSQLTTLLVVTCYLLLVKENNPQLFVSKTQTNN